jgi:hypothetical protein
MTAWACLGLAALAFFGAFLLPRHVRAQPGNLPATPADAT